MSQEEITNLELTELRDGLIRLRNVQSGPKDTNSRKTAIMTLASRVGNASRILKPLLETFDEQDGMLIEKYCKRDSEDRPVPILGDKGERLGVELADPRAFAQERKELLKQTCKMPELKGITFELLAKCGISPDGELVDQLGSFLSGDPEEAYANIPEEGEVKKSGDND